MFFSSQAGNVLLVDERMFCSPQSPDLEDSARTPRKDVAGPACSAHRGVQTSRVPRGLRGKMWKGQRVLLTAESRPRGFRADSAERCGRASVFCSPRSPRGVRSPAARSPPLHSSWQP